LTGRRVTVGSRSAGRRARARSRRRGV